MIALSLGALASVTGGGSSSDSGSIPGASYQHTRSDYATCVDHVTQQTAQQYPSTKLLGVFGQDRNAAPRAEATMRNMRDVCGLPPH
ncbi:MAG: hypothetical protein ACM31C_06855 [Acidobacteriota bacterium]